MGIANENGNKTRLNMGSGMGMNQWEWKGMGLIKTFSTIRFGEGFSTKSRTLESKLRTS